MDIFVYILPAFFVLKGLKCDINDTFTTSNTIEITTEFSSEINTTELSIANSTCDTNNNTDCLIFNETDIFSNKSFSHQRKIKNKDIKKPVSTLNNICTCNLQANFCDINCCCDPKCTAHDRQIFKSCTLDKHIVLDTKYCSYTEPSYVNNSLIEKQVDQDSLFCVMNHNSPKVRLVQKTDPIPSYQAAKIEKRGRILWNKKTVDQKFVNLKSLKRYVYDDPIVIVNSDSKIDYFRLPGNFLTIRCMLEKQVKYLKDFKRSCNLQDGRFAKLNFSTYFENIKIIASPNNISINMIQKDLYKKCPKKVCLNIEPEICDTNWLHCLKINKTNLSCSSSSSHKEKRGVCQQAVKKVHYKFYHNGYNGITQVRVLGILDKFIYSNGQDNNNGFMQEFSVEFLWVNQTTKNYSQIFSGNPGYLREYPILYGTKHIKANTSFIHRNSSRYIDNFLTVPDTVQGLCVRNETRNIPIEFNCQLIVKCQLKSKLKFTAKTRNATNLCRTIQRNLFELWGFQIEKNQTEVFGLFGNANSSNIEEWNEILFEVNPQEMLNNIKGSFHNRNTTLVCQNISSSIDIDILFAKIDFNTILNQQKILAITVEFSDNDIHNREFPIISVGNETVIDITMNLIHRINFLDVTGTKAKKAFEIPSLSIRLPYDFFYPFIKMANDSLRIKSDLIVILFSISFINFLCG